MEKKEALKLGKRLKSKTHFALKEILNLMEYYRTHSEKLDAMEKTEFIGVINANFKFDTKILLDRIFEVFDKDKDGFLTVAELRKIMTAMGERMPKKEFEAMVKEVDKDNDGPLNCQG